MQVNAYNFPCWGPLEKLAPAFLAGVPSIIKPATPTAFLTAELVRLIVDSGVLPDGAVQFLAGSVGDLFDHLTEQDLVSFTGSASTARQLRTHPVLSARAVRFTAEADSLNCSILGPDATPGHPGVRSLRRPAGHRDDGEGRAEVHGDPARVRARRAGGRRDRGRARRSSPRSSSATRPPRA